MLALVLGEFPINLEERLPITSVSCVLIKKFWSDKSTELNFISDDKENGIGLSVLTSLPPKNSAKSFKSLWFKTIFPLKILLKEFWIIAPLKLKLPSWSTSPEKSWITNLPLSTFTFKFTLLKELFSSILTALATKFTFKLFLLKSILLLAPNLVVPTTTAPSFLDFNQLTRSSLVNSIFISETNVGSLLIFISPFPCKDSELIISESIIKPCFIGLILKLIFTSSLLLR